MKIDNVKLPVTATYDEVYSALVKRSGLKCGDVKYFRLLKKSLDARDKNDVKYVYSAEISDEEKTETPFEIDRAEGNEKIVVTGFGPCGMFCALYLARAGFSPIVLERGKKVEDRKKSVDKFISERVLDENSNVQFGEGGAGAFSDGKLNTGISDPLTRAVLKDFVTHGAPKDIEFLAKPHIGSDNLPRVVASIRREIESLGGKILFETKMTDFTVKNGKVVNVITDKGEIDADALVIAVGHSARDTFYTLYKKGVPMERKAFAVGLRIEHLRQDINMAQYGKKYADKLPTADYRLASHRGDRGVFTFCMCPGGVVMPAASERGGVVTNGMSLYARNAENSNSAVLCEVYPDDFPVGVLGGVEFQRGLERLAFIAGGSDYTAPAQTFGAFADGSSDFVFGKVKPSYPLGVNNVDFNRILPKFIADNLKVGISDMGNKLKGFSSEDAVLTGVETRSSSPVRVLRNDFGVSPVADNLYACGEGCGYAGGIMSAAVDGIKTAAKIALRYKNKGALT